MNGYPNCAGATCCSPHSPCWVAAAASTAEAPAPARRRPTPAARSPASVRSSSMACATTTVAPPSKTTMAALRSRDELRPGHAHRVIASAITHRGRHGERHRIVDPVQSAIVGPLEAIDTATGAAAVLGQSVAVVPQHVFDARSRAASRPEARRHPRGPCRARRRRRPLRGFADRTPRQRQSYKLRGVMVAVARRQDHHGG